MALFFIILAAVVSGALVSGISDYAAATIIILSLIVVVTTFIDINIGLVAILLSMLLSPELEVGSAAGRSVIIRAEDLLLILVSLTWLMKMAFVKQLPLIRSSQLNAPIGIYVAILSFSTLRGMIVGDVMPLKGMFYVFKIVEYFILYFIVLNHTTSEKQVKLFLTVLIVTAVIVGIFGNTHIGKVDRISAPFEGSGEPNTLGGYLLFILAILGGLIFHYRERRLLFALVFIFLVPTFVFTLSRASYMGFLPALAAFVFLSKDKRVINAILMVFLCSVLLVAFGPKTVRDRVVDTFKPEPQQKLKQVGTLRLGPSPAARVESWNTVLTKFFPKKPLLGYGTTGIFFLDSQYILVLAETGILGLIAFLWIFLRIWVAAIKTYNTVETPLNKGITLGYLSGLVGLMVQAIGTNTFIIIRIAEPFWFFTAIVMKLTDIETGKAQMEDIMRDSKR